MNRFITCPTTTECKLRALFCMFEFKYIMGNTERATVRNESNTQYSTQTCQKATVGLTINCRPVSEYKHRISSCLAVLQGCSSKTDRRHRAHCPCLQTHFPLRPVGRLRVVTTSLQTASATRRQRRISINRSSSRPQMVQLSQGRVTILQSSGRLLFILPSSHFFSSRAVIAY